MTLTWILFFLFIFSYDQSRKSPCMITDHWSAPSQINKEHTHDEKEHTYQHWHVPYSETQETHGTQSGPQGTDAGKQVTCQGTQG